MISVVIPTLNAEASLPATFESLLEANRLGLISEVIVSDGGSSDETALLADGFGAKLLRSEKGRGAQLRRGAEAARGEWLLFLHADTRLLPGWEEAAVRHMESVHERKAAVFRLAFDARGVRPRLVALGANIRTRLLRLPYGDQGLLMSRRHYDRLGGFSAMPLFEDVDLIRRITREGGRQALAVLDAVAVTSPIRYEREGYLRRVLGNARLLSAYLAGTPTEELARRYHDRIRTTPRGDGETAPDGPREDAPR